MTVNPRQYDVVWSQSGKLCVVRRVPDMHSWQGERWTLEPATPAACATAGIPPYHGRRNTSHTSVRPRFEASVHLCMCWMRILQARGYRRSGWTPDNLERVHRWAREHLAAAIERGDDTAENIDRARAALDELEAS